MATGLCPNKECGKMIDLDGYVEHGKPMLFACSCGKIYDMPKMLGELVEVLRAEVDLNGLDFAKMFAQTAEYYHHDPNMSNGGFIYKSRWKKGRMIK